MAIASILAALLFGGLALAHSLAGETGFIRPLVNADWEIADVPRWAANRLLRTAWHLTSVAWLAMATIAIGASPVVAISLAAIASGLMMLVGLAGHPAWPMFLLAGLAGLYSEDLLGSAALTTAAAVTIVVLLAMAALHGYWVAGGTAGLDAAVPTTVEGQKTFTPPPLLTAAVAALLIAFAGLIAMVAFTDEPAQTRWLVLAGAAVMAARAIGDGKYAGFSKKERDTTFGRMDDQYFTPLCVMLAIGATAAVLI